MKLPLVYYGDPILRKKGTRIDEINDDLRQFINDMEETLLIHQGYGLAAPQVNRSIALFLINIAKQVGPDEWLPGKTHVLINPKILEVSEEENGRGEGCLSIPGVYAPVSRPSRIKVEYTDVEGNTVTKEFTGIEARAVMHENDHINGVLFIDRIRGKEREKIEPELRAVKKKYYDKKK